MIIELSYPDFPSVDHLKQLQELATSKNGTVNLLQIVHEAIKTENIEITKSLLSTCLESKDIQLDTKLFWICHLLDQSTEPFFDIAFNIIANDLKTTPLVSENSPKFYRQQVSDLKAFDCHKLFSSAICSESPHKIVKLVEYFNANHISTCGRFRILETDIYRNYTKLKSVDYTNELTVLKPGIFEVLKKLAESGEIYISSKAMLQIVAKQKSDVEFLAAFNKIITLPTPSYQTFSVEYLLYEAISNDYLESFKTLLRYANACIQESVSMYASNNVPQVQTALNSTALESVVTYNAYKIAKYLVLEYPFESGEIADFSQLNSKVPVFNKVHKLINKHHDFTESLLRVKEVSNSTEDWKELLGLKSGSGAAKLKPSVRL